MIKVFRLGSILMVLCFVLAVGLAVFFLRASAGDGSLSAAAGTDALPTLVIDPGHGGDDGGAVSLTGTHESVINFDIARDAASIAGLTGVPFQMTRTTESIEYPAELKTTSKRKVYDQQSRVAFINGTENAVLLSIHQNFFPKKSAHGPQAFYAKTPQSDILAGFFAKSLDAALLPDNTRAVKPIAPKIYLMKNVKCPAVLVECGFLSNMEEAKLLDTKEYRLKIAAALMSGYLSYLNNKGNGQE